MRWRQAIRDVFDDVYVPIRWRIFGIVALVLIFAGMSYLSFYAEGNVGRLQSLDIRQSKGELVSPVDLQLLSVDAATRSATIRVSPQLGSAPATHRNCHKETHWFWVASDTAVLSYQAFDPDTEDAKPVTVQLPLIGRQRDFPFDSYRGRLHVGVVRPAEDKPCDLLVDWQPDSPRGVHLIPSGAGSGFVAAALWTTDTTMDYSFERSAGLTWVFVGLLLLVYVAVIALLAFAWLTEIPEVGVIVGSFALGVGVATIRNVLVPDQLNTLTAIDYFIVVPAWLGAATAIGVTLTRFGWGHLT